ncbi:MAG TPA: hypothetical protein VGX78_06670 [Pirellulales bacterium]|nr:hypothetical protein [Pirellulales bacterium]
MRRARAALLGGLAAFVAIQMALGFVLDGPWAGVRDAEYGEKLARLRARLREEPEAPFVLLLGSSRSANGVVPDRIAATATAAGQRPVVFNFALPGFGPVQELVLFERLLRRGIRPDRLLIEIHPALLHQEPDGCSEFWWMRVERLEALDLPVVLRYVAEPGRWSWHKPRHWPWLWWHGRLAPVWSYRLAILDVLAPAWVPSGLRLPYLKQIDAWGWFPSPFPPPTDDDRRRWVENARIEYAPVFDRYHVTSMAERALREILDDCRREGIAAALFLMPEGSNFRAMYPPGARDEIESYLAGLRAEYGVSVFDATSCCGDDDFADGHHLYSEPAAKFSERFGRELVRPWLAGTHAAARLELVHRTAPPGSEQREARE